MVVNKLLADLPGVRTFVNEIGATGAAPPPLVDGLWTVYFDHESWVVRAQSRAMLDQIARGLSMTLEADPAPRVQLVGHDDSLGEREYSDWLSLRRARTVADELVARGIPRERLEVTGKVKRQLVALPDDSAGKRAENRRG